MKNSGSSIRLAKGKLLVAEPSILNDTAFNRSVILLSEHNNEGSVGFIMNKPSDFNLNDLIPEMPNSHIIYIGGPVSRENLYFIHNVPELIPDSQGIGKGLYWGGDFATVQALLLSNEISADNIRFFLGYSGWSKDQLQDELETTSWIVMENKFTNIFRITDSTSWKEQLLKFGKKYQLWANAPENPSLN